MQTICHLQGVVPFHVMAHENELNYKRSQLYVRISRIHEKTLHI